MVCRPGSCEETHEGMKEKRRNLRWIWAVPGILLAICLAAWLILFRFNRFTLCVALNGAEEITLEYGESYEEPGASVILTGTLFFRAMFRVAIKAPPRSSST